MRIIMMALALLIFCRPLGTSVAQEKEYVVGRGTTNKAGVQLTKPVISKSVQGVKITVWMGVTESTGATHFVRVGLQDAKSKIPVNDAEVWFHIVYPSKKNLMPKLKITGDYYEGNIDLSEKGKYKLMVHVNIGEKHPAIIFSYLVK